MRPRHQRQQLGAVADARHRPTHHAEARAGRERYDEAQWHLDVPLGDLTHRRRDHRYQITDRGAQGDVCVAHHAEAHGNGCPVR
ncbi:MAG: hypothetical protein ACREFD_19725 [Stellaceae bacterium]